MAQVKFAYGTKARYDALAPKDMDTLYFTTDTLQLFKGTTEYTKSTKMVSSLPAAGQVGHYLFPHDRLHHAYLEWCGVCAAEQNNRYSDSCRCYQR